MITSKIALWIAEKQDSWFTKGTLGSCLQSVKGIVYVTRPLHVLTLVSGSMSEMAILRQRTSEQSESGLEHRE